MSAALFLAAGIAGGLGAAARVCLDSVITAGRRSSLPWGTAAVNVVGCAAMGALLGTGSSDSLDAWQHVVAVGFLGAFTTFSTASVESVTLASRRGWRAGAGHAGAMLAACLVAFLIGMALTGGTTVAG